MSSKLRGENDGVFGVRVLGGGEGACGWERGWLERELEDVG